MNIIATRSDLQLGFNFKIQGEDIGVPGGTAPGTFKSVTTTVISQSVTTRKYTVEAFVVDGVTYDLENLTPSICSIVNWPVVEYVSAGVGKVRATLQGTSITRTLVFDFTVTGSFSTSYPTGIIEGNYLEYAFDILSPLASNTDLNYYIGSPSLGVVNPSCWAADFDFSGVSIWNSRSNDARRAVTAITARHGAMAWHYRLYVGDTVKFTDGTSIYTRTVIGTTREQGAAGTLNSNPLIGDKCVVLWDSPLPETIAIYPVMGNWIYDQSSPEGDYYAGCGFRVNQQRKILAMFSAFPYTSYKVTDIVGNINGTPATLAGFEVAAFAMRSSSFADASPGGFLDTFINQYIPIVGGDSGSPSFWITGPAEMALWTTFTHPAGGPRWDETVTNLLIEDADLDAIARGNLVSPTGLTVTVAPDPTL